MRIYNLKMMNLLTLFLLFCFNVHGIANETKKYKVLAPYPYLGGEAEMATRLVFSMNRMGWESYTFNFSGEWSYANECDPTLMNGCRTYGEFIYNLKPDFIISVIPAVFLSNDLIHYLVLSRGSDALYYPKILLNFNAYLCVPDKIIGLYDLMAANNKPFYWTTWYPTYPETVYEPVKARKIFYCGMQWDQRRKTIDYLHLFTLLDKSGYMELYGREENWPTIQYSLKGSIPYDGVSLVKAIKNSGICLVLHGQEHLECGYPSGRIFEAAAAGSVIISDRHPFVVSEFGDCVLYIDIDANTRKNGKQMFKQVEAHYKWIQSHPIEAEIMARKAHTIFSERFTLEKQLREVAKMHEMYHP